MKNLMISIFTLVFVFNLQAEELRTVNHVDLNKYMGKWYEIAKYNNWFQKKCGATTAEYKISGNKVKVLNTCIKKSNNKIKKAKGIAFVTNKETNAELKVSFAPLFKYFGLFAGEYFIIELGENYEFAVVGHPSRKYLWILSRTPLMEESLYQDLLTRIENHGYDLNKIQRTPTWE